MFVDFGVFVVFVLCVFVVFCVFCCFRCFLLCVFVVLLLSLFSLVSLFLLVSVFPLCSLFSLFCANARNNPRVCYGHLCPGCSMLGEGCNASLGFWRAQRCITSDSSMRQASGQATLQLTISLFSLFSLFWCKGRQGHHNAGCHLLVDRIPARAPGGGPFVL